MKELIISFLCEGKYSIHGDIQSLLANKRAKMMLRSNLNYKQVDNSLILETGEGIEHVAKILKLIAGYIGATIVYDDKTNADIKDFKLREEDFERFSRDAKNIKNNHCNLEDFKGFVKVLDEHMPCRHLYELQTLCAYHLAFSQNGCNFSVPGAGKTSIVYGAYTYLKNQNDPSKRVEKILIIGPLSSFGPWENEYKECFGVKADCQRINGVMALEEKKQYFYDSTAEITLLSYQSIITIKQELVYFLSHNKVMVVLDEAHKIKNTNRGITATTVMEIAKYCTSRVVLTGTPAPNGYEDLYNLFHFIWPQHDVIKYNVGQLRDMSRSQSDSRIAKMLDNITPYFIRIRKSDLNLPPAIEYPPIYVPMKESQRIIYDFIEQRFIEEANKEEKDSVLHSILLRAKLMRLQQAATNPALLYEPLTSFTEESGEDLSSIEKEDSTIMNEIMRFYENQIPAKYEQCLQLVKDITDRKEKVIIWAIFIKNIERLSDFFKQNGIDCKTLYGATPVASDDMTDEELANTREGIVAEFNRADSSFNVIIANPYAVAESISLHKACHNAIYLERSFNCAHFMQSKDRIHRYGLSKDTITNYYYILSENSVDETIDTRLREKEQRMLDIIENTPIPLFINVTNEGDADIKAILTDYVRRKARKTI